MPTGDGFNNQSILPKVKGKPHIVYVAGYWRVSPLPMGGSFTLAHWGMAHDWVNQANQTKWFHRWLDGLESAIYSEEGRQTLDAALKSAMK